MNSSIFSFAREATEVIYPRFLDAHAWLLVAQAAGGQGAAEGQADAAPAAPAGNAFIEFFANPLNLILISAILFMFIVARPQQKQQRERQQALAGLKKNDRVVTASGIHGVVVQVQADEGLVTLRIDENTGTRLTVNRDSIATITPSDSKE